MFCIMHATKKVAIVIGAAPPVACSQIRQSGPWQIPLLSIALWLILYKPPDGTFAQNVLQAGTFWTPRGAVSPVIAASLSLGASYEKSVG
jgi:hypothetical protein